MNLIPEEVSSVGLESMTAGSRDRCYKNNHTLSCVMNMLQTRKEMFAIIAGAKLICTSTDAEKKLL